MMLRAICAVVFVVCISVTQTTLGADVDCAGGLSQCDWELWGQWSACSKSCGEGTRTRIRGLCCRENQTLYECIKRCDLKDESIETGSCNNVCPTGNCTYTAIPDTGIDATDYQELRQGNEIINAPITLKGSTLDNCKHTCSIGNVNTFSCWMFTYDQANKLCYLYFFNKALEFVHPELTGMTKGQTLYNRNCTSEVPCRATVADIVLVVDSSGSIGAENFEKMKTFLQDLVNGFDIDPALTRVGLMTFNDKMVWQFKLDEFNNKLQVLQAIQKMKYFTGGTVTSQALEKVRTEGFVANRTGVPMLAVVVTDGQSRYPAYTRVQASLLRQAGVDVYSVGIGAQRNYNELYNMASSPEANYLYEFSGFDKLDPSNMTFNVQYLPCKDKQNQNVTTTVSPDVDNCTDTVDNCKGYGSDVCTDYRPWASAHCAKFCGFCVAKKTTPSPCVDNIPNCASYTKYICENKAYAQWVDDKCRRYCGICTSDETTVATTTPMPTTAVPICEDKIDNCESYLDACDNPEYQGYLGARCAATCGFCKSFQIIPSRTVGNNTCPEWYLPTECTLETLLPGCCPLPKCPGEGYKPTAEKSIIQTL